MTDFTMGENVTPEYVQEVLRFSKRLTIINGLNRAYESSSPGVVRDWFIKTFVMDPTNWDVLTDIGSLPMLESMHTNQSWGSIEHGAIGSRLLFHTSPHLIASPPDLLEPDNWREEYGIAATILHLFQPWKTLRYDPIGENWYKVTTPGQWTRHGKGNPSNSVVEPWVHKWLTGMNPENKDIYAPYPITTEGLDIDKIVSRMGAVVAHYRAFVRKATSLNRVRQVLESMPIMQIDTATLNHTRYVQPFSNGALALVNFEYLDTLNQQHKVTVGQVLPLDIEYMVTNANPLAWPDKKGEIPDLLRDERVQHGDRYFLEEYEDNLLLTGCPTYWSFLTHAFPEHEERSAFLRLLGAAMYGTNLKIVAAMIGEPNAGKDTVINWLNYLMPGQVATLPFSAFTAHGDEDRGFAPLRGARVATLSGEVGENRGNKILAERLKAVSSGGGKLRVAEKYEKPTDIWFDGMLIMQGNSVPAISGGDRALYTNRIVAVEFQHPFPLNSRSYDAEYRREAANFAQVLFLNYLKYQDAGGGMQGIRPPTAWQNFAKEFADVSNPNGFVEACIQRSDKSVPTHQFHAALSALAQRFGSPYPTGAYFWPKRLRALGFPFKGKDTVKKQVMEAGNRNWCYYLTVDASKSEGMFTQQQWEQILKDTAVA